MVYKIKLKNIKKYLEDKGWSISDFNSKACKVSKIIADQEIGTMIPNNEAMPDYDIIIEKFIEFLASVEQRDHRKIAEEIENIMDTKIHEDRCPLCRSYIYDGSWADHSIWCRGS